MGEAHFQLEEYEKAVDAFRRRSPSIRRSRRTSRTSGTRLLRLQRPGRGARALPARRRPHAFARREGARARGRRNRPGGRGSEKRSPGPGSRRRSRSTRASPRAVSARADPAQGRRPRRRPSRTSRAIVAVDPLYEGAAYNLGLAYRALKNEAAAKEWEERFKEVRKAKSELEDLKVALRSDSRGIETHARDRSRLCPSRAERRCRVVVHAVPRGEARTTRRRGWSSRRSGRATGRVRDARERSACGSARHRRP